MNQAKVFTIFYNVILSDVKISAAKLNDDVWMAARSTTESDVTMAAIE